MCRVSGCVEHHCLRALSLHMHEHNFSGFSLLILLDCEYGNILLYSWLKCPSTSFKL